LLAAAAGSCLLGPTSFGWAQSAPHPNALDIVKLDGKNWTFQFSLNLPQLLHQALSPQSPLAAFLKTLGDMPKPAFAKEMQKVKAKLSGFAVATLPGGKQLRLQGWQWPDDDVIQQNLKAQFVLLGLPEQARPHLDPVAVVARLQSPQAVNHAQLQLPQATYPIGVSIKNDRFWLTHQIPLAIVNLE
jgi:hypothetical protein